MFMEIKTTLILGLILLFFRAANALFPRTRLLELASVTIVDITNFGAKPDGKTDNALPIIRAWNAVCRSATPAKLFIPEGKFAAGEVVFAGPCVAPPPIVIEVQGTLLGRTDLSLYSRNTWISIEHVCGVMVTGQGTLHGQGEASWKFNDGEHKTHLPDSLVFMKSKDSSIQHLHFRNSKGFHMKVIGSDGIRVDNLHISSPEDSPNTGGIHIRGSTNVNIIDTKIKTGDDCISIGEGTKNIHIANIQCGPGHGISVGGLGKHPNELNVEGVTVKNCTMLGTTNGARIKTYRESSVLTASHIVFEDIVMENVKNPIIIDQNYASKGKKGGSNVELSDVHFRNIKGTSTSEVGVTLNCSHKVPCEVELTDIHLALNGSLGHETGLVSRCINARATFVGKNCPPPCSR